MNRVLVVIPMYNLNDITEKCVDLTIQRSGIPVDILVVDDGSEVPYEDERVEILRIPENLGFTGATNEGIIFAQKRDYEFVHLLNNDTEPEQDFIKHLIDSIDKYQEIGIAASSRVRRNDGKEFIENFGIDLVRGFQFCSNVDIADEYVFCDWIPLCSALMRMDMIREIGILDRRMRNHCSDNDYCVRANHYDWNVALIPKSRVVHHLSMTTKKEGIDPSEDQKFLMSKIAGIKYQELMARLPLDIEQKKFARLTIETFNA